MSNIVVKKSVSISRNVDKFPFPVGLTYKNSKNVEEEIKNTIMNMNFFKTLDLKYRNMLNLDDVEKNYLLSENIITDKLARNSVVSSIFYGNDLSIMVNEEDHIKITLSSIDKGIESLFEKINELDDEVESKIDYAYDSTFGYLTSRITEVGTGLRIKVLLHLPALRKINYINKVIYAVGQIGLSLHEYSDEKMIEMEDFYELSNLITIGKTEWEIIESLQEVIKRIEIKERAARETIMTSTEKQMMDKIFRSYGVLKFARLLSYSEAVANISTARLGSVLGILEGIKFEDLDKLLFEISPEKIFYENGKILLNMEEEEIRANIIRKFMKG